MPARASIERARKAASWSTSTRVPRPTATQIRASSVTRCRPTRLARAGARAPNPANARTGNDVSSPAEAAPMSRPARTSASTGPTLTAAGRRLSESRTMPTRMKTVRRAGTRRWSQANGRRREVTHGTDVSRWRRLRHIGPARLIARSVRPRRTPSTGITVGPAVLAEVPDSRGQHDGDQEGEEEAAGDRQEPARGSPGPDRDELHHDGPHDSAAENAVHDGSCRHLLAVFERPALETEGPQAVVGDEQHEDQGDGPGDAVRRAQPGGSLDPELAVEP